MTLPPEIAWLLDKAAHHLRGEDVADYVWESLPVDERQRADAHLAVCEQCRATVSRVRAAVDADLANPARLEGAAAKIAAGQPVGGPAPAAVAAIPPSPDEGGVLQALGRRIRDWAGGWDSLGSPPWTPQVASASASLAPERPTYVGVQSGLDHLFPPALLGAGLGWAVGPLVIGAAYDATGEIRSIRASVGVRGEEPWGAAIKLELLDQAGNGIELSLSPDQPSDVRNRPPVRGRMADLTARLAVEGDGA